MRHEDPEDKPAASARTAMISRHVCQIPMYTHRLIGANAPTHRSLAARHTPPPSSSSPPSPGPAVVHLLRPRSHRRPLLASKLSTKAKWRKPLPVHHDRVRVRDGEQPVGSSRRLVPLSCHASITVVDPSPCTNFHAPPTLTAVARSSGATNQCRSFHPSLPPLTPPSSPPAPAPVAQPTARRRGTDEARLLPTSSSQPASRPTRDCWYLSHTCCSMHARRLVKTPMHLLAFHVAFFSPPLLFLRLPPSLPLLPSPHSLSHSASPEPRQLVGRIRAGK